MVCSSPFISTPKLKDLGVSSVHSFIANVNITLKNALLTLFSQHHNLRSPKLLQSSRDVHLSSTELACSTTHSHGHFTFDKPGREYEKCAHSFVTYAPFLHKALSGNYCVTESKNIAFKHEDRRQNSNWSFQVTSCLSDGKKVEQSWTTVRESNWVMRAEIQ